MMQQLTSASLFKCVPHPVHQCCFPHYNSGNTPSQCNLIKHGCSPTALVRTCWHTCVCCGHMATMCIYVTWPFTGPHSSSVGCTVVRLGTPQVLILSNITEKTNHRSDGNSLVCIVMWVCIVPWGLHRLGRAGSPAQCQPWRRGQAEYVAICLSSRMILFD